MLNDEETCEGTSTGIDSLLVQLNENDLTDPDIHFQTNDESAQYALSEQNASGTISKSYLELEEYQITDKTVNDLSVKRGSISKTPKLINNRIGSLVDKHHYTTDKPPQCYRIQMSLSEVLDLSQNTCVDDKELIDSTINTNGYHNSIYDNTVIRTHSANDLTHQAKWRTQSDNDLARAAQHKTTTRHYNTTGKCDPRNRCRRNMQKGRTTKPQIGADAQHSCLYSNGDTAHELKRSASTAASRNTSQVLMNNDVENNNHYNSLQRAAIRLQSSENTADKFHIQLQTMQKWFSSFSDEKKNIVLKSLLPMCEVPQIHLLSLSLEPRLHDGCPDNCRDLLSWLPQSVVFTILSYLDPVSLCHASMVCRSWDHLANDASLWRRYCYQTHWRLSHAAEQKQLRSKRFIPNDNVAWKEVFAERYKLKTNWLKGRCNVRTFEGHTQGISCVQFDDTRIVSGSSDKTIKVWNIRTNTHTPWSVQTLIGHSGTVRCLHLDGNRLVSGSTDKSIKVWDLSSQQSWSSIACKVTMLGHLDTVRCLRVDESKVISGSYDKTLKVWDLKTGYCKMTLRGHGAAVLCVQFDDEKIVSGSCDTTIKIWTHTGECIRTLCGHHNAVTCLQFDDTRLVSGSLDYNLIFWDMRTAESLKTIDWKASEGHTGVVRCLQADSWRVVSASDDRTLKVWCLNTGQRLLTLRNHTDGVTCLQFNDSVIVSGSYDKTVKLWDFSSC